MGEKLDTGIGQITQTSPIEEYELHANEEPGQAEQGQKRVKLYRVIGGSSSRNAGVELKIRRPL